jgi:hypothetical protein
MGCAAITVLGKDGPELLLWFLAGAICLLGAGLLYWARRP